MKSPTSENRNLEKISLEKLHQESRNWLSSVAFWNDEVRFMHNLINNNFVYFVSKDRKGSLNALINKITAIEKVDLEALKIKVIKHEEVLSHHLKNHTAFDLDSFNNEHQKISKDFAIFQNNYRLLKGELFRMAEEVLKEKDLKQLVN